MLRRVVLSDMDTDEIFSALANPVRRSLLELLADGPHNAGSLAGQFELSRPAVSEHLRALEDAELVVGVRRGRERYYHLHPESRPELDNWLRPFDRYWRGRLCDLAELLEDRDHIATESMRRGGQNAPPATTCWDANDEDPVLDCPLRQREAPFWAATTILLTSSSQRDIRYRVACSAYPFR